MTGKEDIPDVKPKVKILAPTFGIDKARFGGPGFRSKSFAITDLLGLETDLQPNQVVPGVGGNADGQSAGFGGFSFAGGSLPLGLGFLCNLAAQQPPGTPCFMPSHIPLLQSRTETHFIQNLDQQRENYSGMLLSLLFRRTFEADGLIAMNMTYVTVTTFFFWHFSFKAPKYF